MVTSQPTAVVSNWQIMRTLVAKDWQLLRVQRIVMLTIEAACFLVAIAAILTQKMPEDAWARSLWTVENQFFFGSSIAVAITCITASSLGGVALAGERKDRTAEFTALLPVTRKQVILSKWLTSVGMLAACLFLPLLVNGLVGLCNLWERVSFVQLTAVIAVWLGCTLSLFGIAWLFSTFSQSAAISACASLGIAVSLLVLINAHVDQAARTGDILAGQHPSEPVI